MNYWLPVLLTVAAATVAGAAPSRLLTEAPLAQWAEPETLDPCVEGLTPEGVNYGDQRTPPPLPQPPYGQWEEVQGRVLAKGQAACWSTRLVPGVQRDRT